MPFSADSSFSSFEHINMDDDKKSKGPGHQIVESCPSPSTGMAPFFSSETLRKTLSVFSSSQQEERKEQQS
jgi:hypothetical protein